MFTWTDAELNQEQVAAIGCPGNVLLVACPGSGKTRALTYKLAYELSRLESTKHFIVAITYTNRAAEEIHERIERLGVDPSHLWIGTIHAFCLEWILRPYAIYHENLKNGFRIINSYDSEKLLTELCRAYQQPGITYWDCGFYFKPDGYFLACTDSRKRNNIINILEEYFSLLQQRRQIDFELILFYAYELLRDNPSIPIVLSKIFPFILVDEYQDTKEIQYHIIASILKTGQGSSKTFIVGDPNQAIFQSLGGYPMPAVEFNCLANLQLNEMNLSQNYRSPEIVVNYFSNFNVYQTKIESASHNRDYPSLVSLNDSVAKSLLAEEIVRLIRYNIDQRQIPPHEICVLAPWWNHLGNMTRRLVSSLPGFYFNGPGLVPFSRDIENFWYKLSKIILTTSSPEMYVRRLRWAGDILKDLRNGGVDVSRFSQKELLRGCNSLTILEMDGLAYLKAAFDGVFNFIGIDFHLVPFLEEHYQSFFDSSQARILRMKSDGSEFIADIASFRRVFEERKGITVSTIHGIKGDEYECVIAYALLEGFVPHFNDPDSQNSAKKLLYVISSRSKKNLHLISERERMNYRNEEYSVTQVLADYSFNYSSVP